MDGAGELRERVERLMTAARVLNVVEAAKLAADAFDRISRADSLAEARDYAERALVDMAKTLDDGQVADG